MVQQPRTPSKIQATGGKYPERINKKVSSCFNRNSITAGGIAFSHHVPSTKCIDE